MRPKLIDKTLLFTEVVKAGSITKAASQLKTSKSQLSRTIKQLEEELNIQLLQRTTRSLVPTEAGYELYRHCLNIDDSFNEILEKIQSQESAITGEIKITAPITWGSSILSPLITHFMKQYPGIRVMLDLTDACRDMIMGGYDIAFRVSHQLPDSSLYARKLLTCKYVVCASPDYLKKYGTPETIEDLSTHNIITNFTINANSSAEKWTFIVNKKNISVKVNSIFAVNNYLTQHSAILAGIGIGKLPDIFIKEDIKHKKLIPILKQYPHSSLSFYALYPEKKYLSKRIHTFLDYIKENIKDVIKQGVS